MDIERPNSFDKVSAFLKKETDMVMKRAMLSALALTALATVAYTADTIYQKATFADRYASASDSDKVRMVTPLAEQHCSTMNSMTVRTGLMSDNSDCLRQRAWARTELANLQP